jgi:hypothetical protein
MDFQNAPQAGTSLLAETESAADNQAFAVDASFEQVAKS